MPKKKYRRYSPEFKRHALKRASEDGVTDNSIIQHRHRRTASPFPSTVAYCSTADFNSWRTK